MKTYLIAILALFVASCATTEQSTSVEKTEEIVTQYPNRIQSEHNLPVVYGSGKRPGNRLGMLATAQLAVENELTSVLVVSPGINKLTIFISDHLYFITAEVMLYAEKGESYVVNFDYRGPSKDDGPFSAVPLKVERIWITNSSGKTIEEITSWSRVQEARRLLQPNMS